MYKIVSDKYEPAPSFFVTAKNCCASLCEAHPRTLHTAAEHAYSAAVLTAGNLGQIAKKALHLPRRMLEKNAEQRPSVRDLLADSYVQARLRSGNMMFCSII